MSDIITIDSNILIYAFATENDYRKDVSKQIILNCRIISLQAINETIFVLLRKFSFPKNELEGIINFFNEQFIITSLTTSILQKTIDIIKKYDLSFWDSMMIAAALNNHCNIFYTEDLTHQQIIENKLQIINPFL
jgi:predicted nucleic acid-binding protein